MKSGFRILNEEKILVSKNRFYILFQKQTFQFKNVRKNQFKKSSNIMVLRIREYRIRNPDIVISQNVREKSHFST